MIHRRRRLAELALSENPINSIVIPDIGLEDGDVDVGVEGGLVGEVPVDAPELGEVAEDGERVEGVDETV